MHGYGFSTKPMSSNQFLLSQVMVTNIQDQLLQERYTESEATGGKSVKTSVWSNTLVQSLRDKSSQKGKWTCIVVLWINF